MSTLQTIAVIFAACIAVSAWRTRRDRILRERQAASLAVKGLSDAAEAVLHPAIHRRGDCGLPVDGEPLDEAWQFVLDGIALNYDFCTARDPRARERRHLSP